MASLAALQEQKGALLAQLEQLSLQEQQLAGNLVQQKHAAHEGQFQHPQGQAWPRVSGVNGASPQVHTSPNAPGANNTVPLQQQHRASMEAAPSYAKLASSLAALAEAQRRNEVQRSVVKGHSFQHEAGRSSAHDAMPDSQSRVMMVANGDMVAGGASHSGTLLRMTLEGHQAIQAGGNTNAQQRFSAPEHRYNVPSVDAAADWVMAQQGTQMGSGGAAMHASIPPGAVLGGLSSQDAANMQQLQLLQLQMQQGSSGGHMPGQMGIPAGGPTAVRGVEPYGFSSGGHVAPQPATVIPTAGGYVNLASGGAIPAAVLKMPVARSSVAGTAGNPVVRLPSGTPMHALAAQGNTALHAWLADKKVQAVPHAYPLTTQSVGGGAPTLLSGVQLLGQQMVSPVTNVNMVQAAGPAWSSASQLPTLTLDQQQASLLSSQGVHLSGSQLPAMYVQASASESGLPVSTMQMGGAGLAGFAGLPQAHMRPSVMTPRTAMLSSGGGSNGGSKRSGASRRRKAKMYQALNAMVQAVVEEGVDQELAEAAATAAAATLKGGVPNLPGGSAACASVVQAVFSQRLQQQLLLRKLSASVQTNAAMRVVHSAGGLMPGASPLTCLADSSPNNSGAFAQVSANSLPNSGSELSSSMALNGSSIPEVQINANWQNLLQQILAADMTEASAANGSVSAPHLGRGTQDEGDGDSGSEGGDDIVDSEDLQLLKHLAMRSRGSPLVRASGAAGPYPTSGTYSTSGPYHTSTDHHDSGHMLSHGGLHDVPDPGASLVRTLEPVTPGSRAPAVGDGNRTAAPGSSTSVATGSTGGQWSHIPSAVPGSTWARIAPPSVGNSNSPGQFYSDTGASPRPGSGLGVDAHAVMSGEATSPALMAALRSNTEQRG